LLAAAVFAADFFGVVAILIYVSECRLGMALMAM